MIFGKSWLSFTLNPPVAVACFAMHLASPAVPHSRPLPALLTKLQELHVAPRRCDERRCDEWIEEDEGQGGLCGGPFLRQHKISQTELLWFYWWGKWVGKYWGWQSGRTWKVKDLKKWRSSLNPRSLVIRYGCWTKNRGKSPPKWMVYNGQPY